MGNEVVEAARERVAKRALKAFNRLVNRTAKQMDADSDYNEAVAIAMELGATSEQAAEIARELGRTP